jgi:hypothetical protein
MLPPSLRLPNKPTKNSPEAINKQSTLHGENLGLSKELEKSSSVDTGLLSEQNDKYECKKIHQFPFTLSENLMNQ